jgi:hypothetical protein
MSMMNEGGPPPEELAPGDATEPGEMSEPGEGKQPQEAVHYRAGTPLKNCGLCEHFEGVPGKAPDGCEAVDGTISPFGYCDIYVKQPNPFGDQHKYQLSGDQIMPAAAAAAAPSVRIGNKTYVNKTYE